MTFVMLTDRRFLPGLFALLQSLRENSGLSPLPRVIVVIEGPPLSREMEAALSEHGLPLTFVQREVLGEVRHPFPPVHKRYANTLQKLLIFGLPEPGPLCYLDVDLLCLNPLDGLDSIGPFSAAPDLGKAQPVEVDGLPMFNAGFFIYRPDRARLADLLAFMARTAAPQDTHGDQLILNRYFHREHRSEVRTLDPSWNTLKRLKVHQPALFDPGRIRLLHYVGRKPWRTTSWHPGEPEYLDINRLWWGFFSRSEGPKALGMASPWWPLTRVRAAMKSATSGRR
jgi:lipopolysaccharide biosynthesis glycosyltransferase